GIPQAGQASEALEASTTVSEPPTVRPRVSILTCHSKDRQCTRFSRPEKLVLEALLVMSIVELNKGLGEVVKFKQEQLIDVLRVRGKKPSFDAQRLSSKYLRRFVSMPDRNSHASVFELLIRTEVGDWKRSTPSSHKVTPLLLGLLGPDPEQPQKSPPSPRPEAQSTPAGSGAVPPPESAGEPARSDLTSL